MAHFQHVQIGTSLLAPSFEEQYKFGIGVLKDFGVIK